MNGSVILLRICTLGVGVCDYAQTHIHIRKYADKKTEKNVILIHTSLLL